MTGRIWLDVDRRFRRRLASVLACTGDRISHPATERRSPEGVAAPASGPAPTAATTDHQSKPPDRGPRPSRPAVRLPGHTHRCDPRLHSHPRVRRRCHRRHSHPAQRVSPRLRGGPSRGLARHRRRVRRPLPTGQTSCGRPCEITGYLIAEPMSEHQSSWFASSRASASLSHPCQRMTGSIASAPTGSAHHQPTTAYGANPEQQGE